MEPLLIQGTLILFAGSAIFAGFWATTTFLLADAPYHYSMQVAVILSSFLSLAVLRKQSLPRFHILTPILEGFQFTPVLTDLAAVLSGWVNQSNGGPSKVHFPLAMLWDMSKQTKVVQFYRSSAHWGVRGPFVMPHFHCSNSIAKDLHFTATRLSVTLEWYIYCEYVGSGDKDPWHLSQIFGSGSIRASNRPGPARQP